MMAKKDEPDDNKASDWFRINKAARWIAIVFTSPRATAVLKTDNTVS